MGNIVSRFPNGVNNTTSGDWNDDLTIMDPLRNIVFFDDFANANSFPVAASGLAAASNNIWTVTVTEGGAGDASASYLTGTGAGGGILVLTTDAADNDAIFAQRKGESYLMAAGKKCFFKTRFKLTDATANAASFAQSEFYFGLMITDTDPFSSTAGAGVTDGMFFMKEDGNATVDFYVQKAANTQVITSAVATGTVNTYMSLAFAFDGERYVRVWKDDAYVTTVDLTATLSAYLPDAPITVSFGVKNGEAVAKVMSVDYIFCAQER